MPFRLDGVKLSPMHNGFRYEAPVGSKPLDELTEKELKFIEMNCNSALKELRDHDKLEADG